MRPYRNQRTYTAKLSFIAKINESVEFLKSDKVDYEFRTTVTQNFHTIDDIEKLAMWIEGTPKYFLQNFVDSGDLIGENFSAVEPEKLETMRKIASQYIDIVGVRGV